jgi:hypothetical protein
VWNHRETAFRTTIFDVGRSIVLFFLVLMRPKLIYKSRSNNLIPRKLIIHIDIYERHG